MEPPAHYRASPAERSRVELRALTAPLAGRKEALSLLAFGALAASLPQAAELRCARGSACVLEVHRGFGVAERALELRALGQVVPGPENLRLLRSARLLEGQREPLILRLPARGIYRGADGVWRNDDGLVEAARGFFLRGAGDSFAVRQRAAGGPERIALGVSLVAPLLGLAALAWSERKTRWIRLSLDPNLRTARARSVGFGGATLDRTCALGPDASLQRVDDLGTYLPLVRAVGGDAATLPLLTGHAFAHRADLDRLVDRANRALREGSAGDPSARALSRVAGTALIALGLAALVARVLEARAEQPSTRGTLEVSCSIARCAFGGVTLTRGARMEWGAAVGRTTQRFSVDGDEVPVTFEVQPGARTRFDCAALERIPGRPLLATPAGVTPSR
ncbi:MAG: hypothetical protein R3A48_21205 [Polyangiales bacterium]